MRTSQNSRRFVTIVLFSLGLVLAASRVAQAEPSAVSGYNVGGSNWDGSPPTFTTDGLVHETVYYTDTTASETTAGQCLVHDRSGRPD